MNERARASLRRHAALLAALLFHVGLAWLALPFLINRTEPLPSDPLDVAIATPPLVSKPQPKPKPPPPPKPKPIRAAPTARTAETNASEGRPYLRPAPRLARIPEPPSLTLPAPMAPNPPMSLPPAAASPAAGPPGNGAGAGAGNGSQEGNDYLIRLKAFIDGHKGGARHLEPHDADMVLVLDPDGRLTDIRVVNSSGDPAVDDEIMAQLKRMSPFPKPPAILFSPSKQLLSVADKWIFPRP